MKTLLIFKYLSFHTKKDLNKGFTLIELLVVVIIIGVLAGIALPNFLAQVGKGREAEGKNGIGTLNRSQQAYHFEKQSFAAGADFSTVEDLLGTKIDQKYFTFSGPATADASTSFATQNATPINAFRDGMRPYAGAVGFTAGSGAYSSVVCQGDVVATTPITIASATTPACPSGSTPLQ